MTDPLNDPRFPNRPQHPDFWRMSECILRIDGAATEGDESVEDILGVNMPSFIYTARQRVTRARDIVGVGTLEMLLLTVYMDAFALGKLYAEHPSTRYEEGLSGPALSTVVAILDRMKEQSPEASQALDKAIALVTQAYDMGDRPE